MFFFVCVFFMVVVELSTPKAKLKHKYDIPPQLSIWMKIEHFYHTIYDSGIPITSAKHLFMETGTS